MCLCYLFNWMTTSESIGRFFYKTNRFESIRKTNRIDSNRELECSSTDSNAKYNSRTGKNSAATLTA